MRAAYERPVRLTCSLARLVAWLTCIAAVHAAANGPATVTAGTSSSAASSAAAHAAAQRTIQRVGVTEVAPNSVTQFVPTQLTVELNTSLCRVLAEAPGSRVSLHLASAGKDGRDAVFDGRTRTNCTQLVFPVTLNSSVRNGSFNAKVRVLAEGGDVQLPQNITIVKPLVLAMLSPTLSVNATGSKFAVAVALSGQAPSDSAVSVSVDVSERDSVQVSSDVLTWQPGEGGQKLLFLSLTAVPHSARLAVELGDAEGAVVDLPRRMTVVSVRSPVVSYVPNKGFYRLPTLQQQRLQPPPVVQLTLNGVSDFPVSFIYRTFVLNSSQPNPDPCPTLSLICPFEDDAAVRSNLSVTGLVTLQRGQLQPPPIVLQLAWERVAAEAEYRVGLQLLPMSNAWVAADEQLGEPGQNGSYGDLAAVIFGTSPGHCPPGATVKRKSGGRNDSAGSDVPTYGGSAALQELSLQLGNRSTDLDPPFRPLTTDYTALLPFAGRSNASLALASSRRGDVVVVESSDCDSLPSVTLVVQYRRKQQLWHGQYNVTGQRRSCVLRVRVLTPNPPVLYGPSDQVVFGVGTHTTFAMYSIKVAPLSDPALLSLGAVSFVNDSTTVLACGVPAELRGNFKPVSAGGSSNGSDSSGSSSGGGWLISDGSNSSSRSSSLAPVVPPVALPGSPGDWQLTDPDTGRRILWTSYSRPSCSVNHYVLVPLGVVSPGMVMRPELPPVLSTAAATAAKNAGLGIRTSTYVVAPQPTTSSGDGGSDESSSSGDGGSSSPPAPPPPAYFAAGYGISGGGIGGAAASAAVAETAEATGSSDTTASPLRNASLPGVVVEVPVITTADAGLSSKTFTIVLFSNESAGAVLAAAPVPASPVPGSPVWGGDANSDDAAVTEAVFGRRPAAWPLNPAQNPNCSICPSGMYSSKVDEDDCQVCPPGKYAPAALATSCSLCPVGTFSYAWGSRQCRVCLPGTYAAASGSLYCDICPDGFTTFGEGAEWCNVDLSAVTTPTDLAILLSFAVRLNGMSLEQVTRDTTGINATSEGIVAVLVRSDTAHALNVSLDLVQIRAVHQIAQRALLVNVSATVPVDAETAAAQGTLDLSADALVQHLIEDPNTFLRTTQTLGAESASIEDVTAHNVHLQSDAGPNLNAILWPCIMGSLLLLASLGYGAWRWRRRRLGGGRGARGVVGGGLGFSSSIGNEGGLLGPILGAASRRWSRHRDTSGPPSDSGSSGAGSGSSSIEIGDVAESSAVAALDESYAARLRFKQQVSAGLGGFRRYGRSMWGGTDVGSDFATRL